jgi:hypothetical protein
MLQDVTANDEAAEDVLGDGNVCVHLFTFGSPFALGLGDRELVLGRRTLVEPQPDVNRAAGYPSLQNLTTMYHSLVSFCGNYTS